MFICSFCFFIWNLPFFAWTFLFISRSMEGFFLVFDSLAGTWDLMVLWIKFFNLVQFSSIMFLSGLLSKNFSLNAMASDLILWKLIFSKLEIAVLCFVKTHWSNVDICKDCVVVTQVTYGLCIFLFTIVGLDKKTRSRFFFDCCLVMCRWCWVRPNCCLNI